MAVWCMFLKVVLLCVIAAALSIQQANLCDPVVIQRVLENQRKIRHSGESFNCVFSGVLCGHPSSRVPAGQKKTAKSLGICVVRESQEKVRESYYFSKVRENDLGSCSLQIPVIFVFLNIEKQANLGFR